MPRVGPEVPDPCPCRGPLAFGRTRMYIYIYIYIHTYIYIYIYIHTHIHTHIHIHIQIYIYIYIYTRIHIHLHLHMHIYIYICSFIDFLGTSQSLLSDGSWQAVCFRRRLVKARGDEYSSLRGSLQEDRASFQSSLKWILCQNATPVSGGA